MDNKKISELTELTSLSSEDWLVIVDGGVTKKIKIETIKKIKNVAIKTDDYTLTASDEIIVCNKPTLITITLPEATGSGQTYNIKCIGVGGVIVDGDEEDTIDGELTQFINQWENITVVDISNNTWIIV